MKIKYSLLISFLLLLTSIIAQNKCTQQLNQVQFSQQHNLLASQQNELLKLNLSKNIAQTYCLSSLQVKEIAALFLNENYRLDFSITAYQQVLDKQNFYMVYDVFAYFSTVFQLHDYTIAANTQNQTVNPQQLQINFPPLTYPSFQHYNGPTGCSNPINENQFNEIAAQVLFQQNPIAQLAVATNLTVTNCLGTAHIMKIASIIQNETYRLQYLKSVYQNTLDLANFGAASQVLLLPENQNNFQLFLQSFQKAPVEIPLHNEIQPCPINPVEFAQIIEAIKNESFNNTRVNVAKTIINSKKCFLATQLKEITAILDFENSKLDFAKYAYPYCTDKDNYFILADALSYSSSKNDLMNFIKSKQ